MKLSRSLVLVAVGLALSISACSQLSEKPSPTLEPQYGTSGGDFAQYVAATENSYLYTLGSVDFQETVLKRFNPLGQELWTSSLATCDDSCSVYPEGLGVDLVGNTYVASRQAAEGSGDNSSKLEKFSPAGLLLWSRPLARDIYPVKTFVATSADGATFVVVQYRFLAKYSSAGTLLFKKPLEGYASAVEEIALARDGSLYTVGNKQLIRYSSTGKLIWQRGVGNAASHVAVSGNSVYTSGYGYSLGQAGFIRLYKFTNESKVVWKRYFKPARSYGNISGLDADVAGNVYLTGLLGDGGDNEDLFVQKYTRSGAVAWTYPGLPGVYDYGSDVSAADSGRVYVVGSTYGKVNGKNYGEADAFLLRLDTTGKKAWWR